MTLMSFISELHDIGKLVDKQALEKVGVKVLGHALYNFDFAQIDIAPPTSPSWYLQYAEKDELRSPYTDMLNSVEANQFIPDVQIRANVLLTKIADGISASITRQVHKGQVGEGVYKLWNPEYYKKRGKYWAAFTDIPSLKSMFKYIDSCKNYQNFFEDFKESLELTPEDKETPSNIVSLYTHLELAGKIFRVLKRHSQLLEAQKGQYVLVYNGQPIKTIREACGHPKDLHRDKGQWVFRLVFCNILFPQSLTRLQDLNIFKLRTGLIQAFSEEDETKDYVLFFTDDFICLFIPKNEELSVDRLLKPFTDKGLIIDYTEMEAELNLLTSSYGKAYREFHAALQTNRYLKVYEKRLNPCVQPEIGPLICDSCQIREGKERIKEQVRECLCDICNGIRDMREPEPTREYAKWEGKAGWIKITLNQNQLGKMLLNLFDEYIDTSQTLKNITNDDKTELKNSFRPLAVQMDFVKDYKKLLSNFKEKIYSMKNETGASAFAKETFLYPIEGYDEFGIFKVNSGQDILSVISTFIDCLEEIFPKCFSGASPIQLAISVAPVKYPYQEHWHFLSEPKGIIDIQSPSGRLTLNPLQYRILTEKIGKANIPMGHFLHRLTEIKASTGSDMMVEVEVYERDNRNKFSIISDLLKEGLTPEQILTFYNLATEEKT